MYTAHYSLLWCDSLYFFKLILDYHVIAMNKTTSIRANLDLYPRRAYLLIRACTFIAVQNIPYSVLAWP